MKPWEPKESVPNLAQPALEARVGDAVAVPTVGPAVAVVEAAVAPGRAELVGRPDAGPGEREGSGSAPAVGPALAVAVPAGKTVGTAPESAPPPESSPPEAPPAATPAPELASVPATPPSPSPAVSAPQGPVSAGAPGFPGEMEEEPAEGEEEACAGDEYTLTITSLEAEGEAVAIVLEHIAVDGSIEVLELEGDLDDARSLVLHLSSEGSCVEVEVLPPDDGEEAGESASAPPAPAP
jgi:hypothetical protein